MIAVGVDIGLSGAYAIVRGQEVVALADLPTRLKSGHSVVRREIDALALRKLIGRDLAGYAPEAVVCLENVFGMRRGGPAGQYQGMSTTFSLGDSRGAIRGVLEAMGLKLDWISPITWKTWYGLKKKPKRASVEKAIELFPGRFDGPKLKYEHRAEALLLARYCWQKHA